MIKLIRAAATSHTLSLAAMEEASRQGIRDADIEHLFLALVINEQIAGQVLRSLRITLDATRDAVVAQHAAQLETLGIVADPPSPGRIVFHETDGYDWTNRAVEVIKRAGSGGNNGDSAAVLRALLAEPSGMIEAVLQRLGVARGEVIARLDEAERIPAHDSPQLRTTGHLSGAGTAFVPAPVEDVWALLASPERMPEWDPTFGHVKRDDAEIPPRPGDTWAGRTRTHRPDGKPFKTREGLQRQRIELLAKEERSLIAWRFTYPDEPRANSRHLTIALEPAAGGTQLGITFAWELNPARRRRPFPGFIVKPLYRFAIWMQLTQIGSSIGRVFRG